MKYKIFTPMALAGRAMAELFGGWDMALQTLVIFMAIDWLTGGTSFRECSEKARNRPMVPWRAVQDGKVCAEKR